MATADVSIVDTGIEIEAGLYDTDSGIKLSVAGESEPRVHITPQGSILAGSGSTPPTRLTGADSFYYDPDGGVPGANSFATMDEFRAAVSAAPYGPKYLVMVPAPAPIVVDFEFDVNGGTFMGHSRADATTVEFQDGGSIVNYGPDLAYYRVYLKSTKSLADGPVLTMSTADEIVIDAGCYMASRFSPFVDMAATSGTCVISLRNSSIVKPSDLGDGGGDYEAVAVTGTPSFAAVAGVTGNCTIRANTIRTEGNFFFLVNTPATIPSLTQTNVDGTITTFKNANALSVGFTAGASGLVATDVDGALKELKTLIDAI